MEFQSQLGLITLSLSPTRVNHGLGDFLPTTEQVLVQSLQWKIPRHCKSTALVGKNLSFAGCGGLFSVLAGPASISNGV